MTGIQLEQGAGELARRLLDPICDLYDAVFSVPPFGWHDNESALHREQLINQLDDPSFGIVVALSDGALIGFAYGVATSMDTFMFCDYAVQAESRGQGVGRALHDRLLESRGEQRATLTVQPTALETKHVYERWGWRMVGTVDGGPQDPAPSFDAYIRDPITRPGRQG